MRIWNPKQHSTERNVRWTWQRAAEWKALPVYLSQPILPSLLLFVPWFYVLPAVVVIAVPWRFIRERFVSIDLAAAAWLFNFLKWPATAAAVADRVISGDYIAAGLAAFWPFAGVVVGGMCCGGGRGTASYQRKLLTKMGYKALDV